MSDDMLSKCPLPEVGSDDWPWENSGFVYSMPGYRIEQASYARCHSLLGGYNLAHFYPDLDPERCELADGVWYCLHESEKYKMEAPKLRVLLELTRRHEQSRREAEAEIELLLTQYRKEQKKLGVRVGIKLEKEFRFNHPVKAEIPHPGRQEDGTYFEDSYSIHNALQARFDWMKHCSGEDWADADEEEIVRSLKDDCETHARQQWFKRFLAQMSEPGGLAREEERAR